MTAVVLVGVGVAGWYGRHQWTRFQVDQWLPLIAKHAGANGLDPDLVAAVVEMESGGNPHAQSDAGARGLMQVTRITQEEVEGRRHAVPAGDLEDPEHNLAVGCSYLAQLWERFHGDAAAVLASYHMGPTRVAKWLADHPGADGAALVADASAAGPKTRAYVAGVLALWEDRKAPQ